VTRDQIVKTLSDRLDNPDALARVVCHDAFDTFVAEMAMFEYVDVSGRSITDLLLQAWHFYRLGWEQAFPFHVDPKEKQVIE
jgi:hypothetical protein